MTEEITQKLPETLNIPDDLSEDGIKAAQTIIKVLQEDMSLDIGGQRTFYSPQEWRERGGSTELYGLNSCLIVIHDGGALHPYLCHDVMAFGMMERMRAALKEQGLYVEQCTRWYSAVYPE